MEMSGCSRRSCSSQEMAHCAVWSPRLSARLEAEQGEARLEADELDVVPTMGLPVGAIEREAQLPAPVGAFDVHRVAVGPVAELGADGRRRVVALQGAALGAEGVEADEGQVQDGGPHL